MTEAKTLPVTVEVSYSGLYPDDSSILRFPKFLKAIEDHGYLLVDGEGNPVDATTDEVEWLTVVDPETGSELSVIVDDIIDEEIELKGFLDVLRAMDDFCKINNDSRIYALADSHVVTSDDLEFDWEFNFELGEYLPPNGAPKQKNPNYQTFSEAFGMSPAEYIDRMVL